MHPYLRMSKADPHGRSHSVDEQADDLTRDTATHGWTLGDSYADPGLSASRWAAKPRGDWARLLADVKGGVFGPTGYLALWEPSRGSRQVGEWVTLLDEMERAGSRIWVSTHSRLYNPANARDRRSLLEDAVDSEYEVAKTRGRVLRNVAANARRGGVHGPAAYGWQREYDPRTRKLVAQTEVPHEAEVIREIYRRIDAGHSMRSIRLDLEARGVRSRKGNVLSEWVIRNIALCATYAGRRAHRDKIYTTEKWQPIVEPALFDRVQARLSDPRRRVNRDAWGRHLLTMIAVCDLCGGPMSSSQHGGEPWHLRCHNNCPIQVNEALMDQVATEAMLGYLTRPDVYEELTRDPGNNPEVERVRQELAATRKQWTELAALVANRRLSPELAAASEPTLVADIKRLERRERELLLPSALAPYVGPVDQVRQRWEAAPMSAKREVARLLLSPGLLGQLRVGRDIRGPWCRVGHDRPKQTCEHRVMARLTWQRG